MPDWRQVIDMLQPWIGYAPPWALLSAMVGLVCAAAFFVVAASGFRSLPAYLFIGLITGPAAQLLGFSLPLPSPPLSIGEVHLPLVAGATWLVLAIARLLHL